jgi:hypothetical protein
MSNRPACGRGTPRWSVGNEVGGHARSSAETFDGFLVRDIAVADLPLTSLIAPVPRWPPSIRHLAERGGAAPTIAQSVAAFPQDKRRAFRLHPRSLFRPHVAVYPPGRLYRAVSPDESPTAALRRALAARN